MSRTGGVGGCALVLLRHVSLWNGIEYELKWGGIKGSCHRDGGIYKNH